MPIANLEDSLCDALEAAGDDYRQAVRTIESISNEIADGAGHEQAYECLQQIALSTRRTESHVLQLREDWRRQGRPPGDRLRAVLARQEHILRDLIHTLDNAERTARSARGQMITTVDKAAKSHEMHAAYARTIRQAAE